MKIKITALALLLAAGTYTASAQKHITKTNLLFGPFFKTAHVVQEMAIGSRFSVVTTMKLRPATQISTGLQNLLNVNDLEYNNPFASSKLSGVGNISEFRIYFKDEPMRGFYIGGFTSIMQHKLESDTYPGTFHDNNDVEYKADLKQTVKFRTIGGGFEMGLQGLINDKVCIDWTIVGIGFAMAKLEGGIEATNTSANFDFRNYTEDVDNATFGLEKFLPIGKTVEKESVSFFVRAPWPVFRTTLNIGFAYGGGMPKMPKEKE